MGLPELSDTTTHDIRVGAAAFYLPEESAPDNQEFCFGYRIVIHNLGDQTVQLCKRTWRIIDGNGDTKHVHGEGVVGEQPILKPGQAFKYTSYCVLPTHWGTMEGHYHMRDFNDRSFDIDIGRFWLATEREAQAVTP